MRAHRDVPVSLTRSLHRMLDDELVWRLGPDALDPDPRVEIERRGE